MNRNDFYLPDRAMMKAVRIFLETTKTPISRSLLCYRCRRRRCLRKNTSQISYKLVRGGNPVCHLPMAQNQ